MSQEEKSNTNVEKKAGGGAKKQKKQHTHTKNLSADGLHSLHFVFLFQECVCVCLKVLTHTVLGASWVWPGLSTHEPDYDSVLHY